MAVLVSAGRFLATLNMIGAFFAAVWLIGLGEWEAIGLGLVGIVVAHILVGFVLGPATALGTKSYAAARRGARGTMMFLALLAYLYVAILITLWCIAVLYVFVTRGDPDARIPMLVWSYGVALGPWAFVASKEHSEASDEGSIQTNFFAQLAYLLVVVLLLVSDASYATLGFVFGAVMLESVLVQLLVAWVTAPNPDPLASARSS